MADELTREQVDALLTQLSTDKDYHALFQTDLPAALARLPGAPQVPKGTQPGSCLRPQALASMEALAAARERIARDWFSLEAQIPKILEE